MMREVLLRLSGAVGRWVLWSLFVVAVILVSMVVGALVHIWLLPGLPMRELGLLGVGLVLLFYFLLGWPLARLLWSKRLFNTNDLRKAHAALDELEAKFTSPAFGIVRTVAERTLSAKPGTFQSELRKGTPPRTVALTFVSNIAGDLLESGQYHIWRGVLNPAGPGPGLLELYDVTLDEAVRSGLVAADWAEKQKAGLRRRIKDVG